MEGNLKFSWSWGLRRRKNYDFINRTLRSPNFPLFKIDSNWVLHQKWTEPEVRTHQWSRSRGFLWPLSSSLQPALSSWVPMTTSSSVHRHVPPVLPRFAANPSPLMLCHSKTITIPALASSRSSSCSTIASNSLAKMSVLCLFSLPTGFCFL